MPKFASATALKLLQQKTGTEPFIVVRINWGGGTSTYTTREIPGANDNILEIGSISNERRSDSMCNVGSVRLKLSDTDGQMKRVIDVNPAENWPAAVYLAFNNTSSNDWIVLLKGRTVGPIEWDETERTLDLGIETLIQSREIGYSALPGDFKDLNPNAEGVPWPLIFGKCCHVPSLMVRRHATAHLQCALRFYQLEIFKLVNNNQDIVMLGNPITQCLLGNQIEPNVLYVDDANEFPKNKVISLIIEDIVFTGKFVSNNKFQISEGNAAKYTNIPIVGTPANDPDANNYQVIYLGNDTALANHSCYFTAPNGKEWYNYCVRQEGRKCWFRFPFRDVNFPFTPIKMAGKKISEAYAISKCGVRDHIHGDATLMKDGCGFRKKNAGANNYAALIARFQKIANDGASWWQVPMDVQVRTWNLPDPDIYVASLSPLSEIKAVWGRRKVDFDGKTRTILPQIPDSYYQFKQGQYKIQGLPVTGILFFKPLCDYPDQQWEDDVLVTATGSIGPNVTDIIQWAIQNYTDLSCDPTMFTTVKGKVADQFCNFALFDKRDALKFCQEIAFQSRCGLVLDNGGLGIVYLPEEPIQQAVFNESNVKNIKLRFTERKDIVTRLIGTYSLTYKDKPHLSAIQQKDRTTFEHILRSLLQTQTRSRSETKIYPYSNNIDAFGLKTREEQILIYNDEQFVKKTCDFWGFRFSNCWRLVEFETWLEGVRLQPMVDRVTLSFTDRTILNTNLVDGLVDSVIFDPKTYTTKICVWLPIVAGSVAMESSFWPG